MPSWGDLIAELDRHPLDKRGQWLASSLGTQLQQISNLRSGRNVLFYASGYLQKPVAHPAFTQITAEDINGFMATMCGMDWSRGLTLILHTPGGIPGAAETIVEYLHEKFAYIEAVVPTYAMSAGTMIALASNLLLMGRQSQLGPIDPQMPIMGRFVSARAIVDQFEVAKPQILENPGMAPVWAPILHQLGPALLVEAENALSYGETMVKRWLERRHFQSREDAKEIASKVAAFFSRAEVHKSHGRRIGRDEASSQGLSIEEFERSQPLQDAILTAYHLATLIFEKSPTVKLISTNQGKMWVKTSMPLPPPGQVP